MEVEPKPETLIAAIKERLREGGVGSIRVWGGNVVRPSDQIYEVKEASLTDGVLRVVLFLALNGQELIVEVDQPRGAKVTASALRVREAAAIRISGKEYKPAAAHDEPALYLGQ